MEFEQQHARLERAWEPLGDDERTLVIGDRPIRIRGLDAELAAGLERRWGAFLRSSTPGASCYEVEFRRAGPGCWLGEPRQGETYRLEALGEEGRRLVSSYHFAVGRGDAPDVWRVGVSDDADEPAERIVENALRYLTADLAVREGGFALHAAGVLHEERAWLFAGASRAGKSTVVGLLAPAPCLGDDFALVLPEEGGGWSAPAVPYDNSERIASGSPTGRYPVAGIWRLYQADTTYVEFPPPGRAVTSLMGCTAFSWAMPDRASMLLEQVERFVATGSYQHLHFTKNASLWSVLI